MQVHTKLIKKYQYMKTLKTLLALGLILFTTEIFGQELPDTYEAMFIEMIDNIELIRSGNSLKKGKHTLTVFSKDKIVLRTTYNKQVKNLTFVKEANEENKMIWVAANQLTIDMVNKHEEDLTEILMEMHELLVKKAQE